jgi:hypothetical protein
MISSLSIGMRISSESLDSYLGIYKLINTHAERIDHRIACVLVLKYEYLISAF